MAARKRVRCSRPVPSHGPDSFICQLERLLKRLGDFHLRISLARLSLDRHGNEAVSTGQTIAEGLQDPCAIAGTMPDGSVVAAFLGPRVGDYTVGDSEMTARIRRRFRQALRMTEAEFMAHALSDLTVAHCWSDEVFDVSSLVLDHASNAHRVVDLGDKGRSAKRQPA
ncbi:MAG: hypothetical protein AB7E71_15080 [Dongiaceae bacterium]